jgi:hypothetical protein
MSHGILKQTILFSSALVLAVGLVVLATPARTAAASDKAISYCQHRTDAAACERGYDGGTGQPPAQSIKDTCGSYPANSSNLDACQSAWGAAAHVDPAVYGACNASRCDFIAKYINPAINLFSLLFGLVAVISLILGGIQYSASQGDPQKAAAAKSRLSNTIIAIFAYIFLYAFLQFLIPGGAFH